MRWIIVVYCYDALKSSLLDHLVHPAQLPEPNGFSEEPLHLSHKLMCMLDSAIAIPLETQELEPMI